MTYAVSAAGPGDQVQALSAGSRQLLTVSQAFPGMRCLELGASPVVRVVTLMRAIPEVHHAIRGDQQLGDGHRGGSASSFQPMHTELAVHLTQVAVSHAAHDDQGTGLRAKLQKHARCDAALVRFCRVADGRSQVSRRVAVA